MGTPERVLSLSGGYNFRDLGGYAAHDGRHVKWRMLFRSGSLAHLTAADVMSLETLGIATVCDFRSTRERSREPFPAAQLPGIDYRCWEYDVDYEALKSQLQGLTATAGDVRAAMLRTYQRLLRQLEGPYQEMFGLLSARSFPLVFNCAAGKDRTGIAAALLLVALGVSEETIIEDYAMSEKIVDYEKRFVAPRLAQNRDTGTGFDFLTSLSPEARAPLLRSDPDYLRTLFAELVAEYGTVLSFIQTRLGVDNAALDDLREQLLQ